MRDFARTDLKRVLWRPESAVAVVQYLNWRRNSSMMLGQSAIGISLRKTDQIRTTK